MAPHIEAWVEQAQAYIRERRTSVNPALNVRVTFTQPLNWTVEDFDVAVNALLRRGMSKQEVRDVEEATL